MPVEIGVDVVVEAIVGRRNVVLPLCKVMQPRHVVAGREGGPKFTCSSKPICPFSLPSAGLVPSNAPSGVKCNKIGCSILATIA